MLASTQPQIHSCSNHQAEHKIVAKTSSFSFLILSSQDFVFSLLRHVLKNGAFKRANAPANIGTCQSILILNRWQLIMANDERIIWHRVILRHYSCPSFPFCDSFFLPSFAPFPALSISLSSIVLSTDRTQTPRSDLVCGTTM